MKAGTVIPPQFHTVMTLPPLHCPGIAFCPVIPQELLPNGVITVRSKTGGKIVVFFWLIIEVIFYYSLLIISPGGIEAHLEVLIIHLNMVKGKFQIGKNT